MIEAIELTSARRSRGARGGPVEKVSFDVYPGQVTALLGAAGAGKSTVLRMMVELEPAGGCTLFGGRPFHALRPAIREVGVALNPDALHPGRTVQAHLQLYSAAGGVPKGRVAEVLEVAGLSTQATVRCGRLDTGQRQRLAIAAALLGDPAALILDEPHALDDHGRSWFHALIRAYAAQGRTVLVAATDPDSLSGTADHVVVLRRDERDGVSRVIASRSAAEVFDERRVMVVQVRSPQAARLAAALEAEGARLAPAGPGALQVRGLDRARIGEVAHVAGICLHELAELGHDDDVFGLRPVPRQKELLPGLNRTEAGWRTGVRLVAEQIEEAEEEAEVVEVAAEITEVGDTADTADTGGMSGGADVGGIGEVGETAQTGSIDSQEPVTAAAAAKAQAKTEARASIGEELPAQGGSTGSAVIGTEPKPSQGGSRNVHLTGFTIEGDLQGMIAGPREPGSEAEKLGPAAAKPRWDSQGSQWWAVKSVADTRADAQPSADAREVARASASAAEEPVSSSTVLPPPDSGSSDEAQPIFVRSFEAAALRRSNSFHLRWGCEKPAESSSPASPQPAVPFTVTAPAPGPAEDGMTPWRAVTLRASRNQQQVPVAEAAPAEQETSA